MIAFHAYQPQGERFFQHVMRELCIGKNLLLCETWRKALFTGAILFRLPLKGFLMFCKATCLWCQLSKVWSHLQKNIVIYNVTFGQCSRVVGFVFRRARGVLRQWDVEALCHKVKPQLPHICKWSLRDGMLESVGSGNQYLLQHPSLIEMDWPSYLGAPSRAHPLTYSLSKKAQIP